MTSDAIYVDDKLRRKDEYYLSIAETVARKSTCLRRKYGAIIVKNDEIISTGYNGSPRGCLNCTETGCMREVIGIGKGDAYNLCVSVHAEQNAIISAKRTDMIGATMYIVGIDVKHTDYDKGCIQYADPSPCLLCHRMIINAGIDRVVGIKPGVSTYPLTEYGVVEIDAGNLSFMKRMQLEYTKTIDKMDEDVRTRAQIRIAAAGPETQDFTDEEKADMDAIRNARKMITLRDDLIVGTQEDEIYARYGLADSEIALLKSGRPVRSVALETLEKFQNVIKDRLVNYRPVIKADQIGATDGTTATADALEQQRKRVQSEISVVSGPLKFNVGMLHNMRSDDPRAQVMRDLVKETFSYVDFHICPENKYLIDEIYDTRRCDHSISQDHPIFTTPNDMVHDKIRKEGENIVGTVSVMGVKRPQDGDIQSPWPKR